MNEREPLPANKLNLVAEIIAAGLLTKTKAREVLNLPENYEKAGAEAEKLPYAAWKNRQVAGRAIWAVLQSEDPL